MIGRPPTCLCGACQKCLNRIRNKVAWQQKSAGERAAIVARRDKEKVRAADRARYYRHRGARLARMREWAEKNPERVAEHKKAWAERNPEKRKAQITAGNAIRDGKLVRQQCEACDRWDTDAHHDDYSKPLEVRWLCHEHHMQLHRRYEEAAA
jgi:hypothetical protein